MDAKRTSRTKVAVLVVAVVLGASVGAVAAGILPEAAQPSSRAAQAWTDRLTAQAEAMQQRRTMDAWSLRLTEQARLRTNDAWSERLNGIADTLGARGMSERATQAWTDRLNGLAGQLSPR
jgi:hypothetical protein